MTLSAAAPACWTQASRIASDVSGFGAGGGAVAYVRGNDLFVLEASNKLPIQIGTGLGSALGGALGGAFAVDDAYVASFSQNPTGHGWNDEGMLTTINYRNGDTTRLGQGFPDGRPMLSAHYAFWSFAALVSDTPVPVGPDRTLTAPADGSAAPVEGPSPTIVDGATIAWIDESSYIWTAPSDGDSPPTRHARVPSGAGAVTLDGQVVYAILPDRVVAFPLDGGQTTTLATTLPPRTPSTGGGPWSSTTVVAGPRSVVWAECWCAPYGPVAACSWVLRAVAGTGGEPQVIDSYTWDRHSPMSGPGQCTGLPDGSRICGSGCPSLGADGRAVYWNHDADLMRLCE